MMNITIFNLNMINRKVSEWHYDAISVFFLIPTSIIIFMTVANQVYAEQKIPKITIYKSPTCECCNKWIKHLEQNGFEVKSHNRSSMTSVKQEKGVKPQHQSCHTAVIDGYFIEGHVPASDIKTLLTDKPEAAGLSVPGMPMGSPGMEGHRKDAYSVLLINKDGSAEIYNRY